MPGDGAATTAFPAILFGVTAVPGVPAVGGGPTLSNWYCPLSVFNNMWPWVPGWRPCNVCNVIWKF